jgi:carboxylesterase
MSEIIPTAEPFFFPGDPAKPGCLLIHGFTAAPKEMRLLGEYLNQRGYTCLGIRLTGHGTNPDAMIRSRREDWIASVEDGYHLLRGVSKYIIFVGLSMGGALALLMSTRLDVKSVAALSTPYSLPVDYPSWFLRAFSRLRKFQPKGKGKPGSGWFDQNSFHEQVSYPQNPVYSTAELRDLLADMRAALPDIRVPVMLLHSRDDKYILPENMEHIHAALVNASDKTKLYVSGSGHVVTKDAARHQVFEAVYEFIGRIGGMD